MNAGLLWHQSRSDLYRVWPVMLLVIALIMLKAYAETSGARGLMFGGALIRADLYRLGVFLLVVGLWRNLWPDNGNEADFLTRPIAPVVLWFPRLCLLAAAVVLPILAAEIWLAQRHQLALSLEIVATNGLAILATLSATSAMVLTYPGTRNAIGIAVLVAIVGTVDQALLLASVMSSLPAWLRAVQWGFVLVVAIVMIHRHLAGHGARHRFLILGVFGFLAFSAGPLLITLKNSDERISIVVATEEHFLSGQRDDNKRDLWLADGGSRAFRLGQVSGTLRWADGTMQKTQVSLDGLTGFPAAAIYPEYKSLDDRGAGRLKLGSSRANPVALELTGYMSERQFSVRSQLPLVAGDHAIDDSMRASVELPRRSDKAATASVTLSYVHQRMVPNQQYHLALVHHRRQEYAMSRIDGFDLNLMADPVLLNVGYRQEKGQVHINDRNLDISPARWLEEAELIIISESSLSASFGQLDMALRPTNSDAFMGFDA